MYQAKAFTELAKLIKTNSSKTIWCYTGYRFEDIINNRDEKYSLLKEVDVLVDGKYIVELKDPALPFRGSSNQRIIDVQASIERGDVTCISV